MFHASPDGAWLAGWVLQSDGTSKLLIVSTNKGDKIEADAGAMPGGMAWLAGSNQLLYCKAIRNDTLKMNHVTYYTYDPKTKARKKAGEIDDELETYQIDPIAADDGSKLFSLTFDHSLKFPSFNVYFAGEGKLKSIVKPANIGSIFDLSSDGSTLYWWLKNPQTNNMNLILWNLDPPEYKNVLEFPRKIDPAEDWALLKVDAPNKQVAISAYSQSNPNLQAVVYYYGNAKNLYTKAVSLNPNEQLTYFDWRGFSSILYGIVEYTGRKQWGIEEIDPVSGSRTVVYQGKDEIEFVDYVPSQQAYYFSVVDNAGSPKAQTRLVRVK
jgi:hypothetical protein